MENNQPNFAERTKRLRQVAMQLHDAAEVVLEEVQHMEAAQTRFAERTKTRADKKGHH